jgi:hypothetical protein
MDKTREIRFLMPPFIMAASMFWGKYIYNWSLPSIPPQYNSAAGIAIFVAAIIPIGYMIGTLSITILRLAFWLCGGRCFEACISQHTLARIRPMLNTTQDVNKAWMLYAVSTFDYETVPKPVNEWIVRRWNAFHTSMSSCVALLLAHLAGVAFDIGQSRLWGLTTGILFVLFGWNALVAWLQTMAMIEFQSYRDLTLTKDKLENSVGNMPKTE